MDAWRAVIWLEVALLLGAVVFIVLAAVGG